jgi:hypothetical protein
VFPGSCYPVIVVYVVHVDPVLWHPTFLVMLLGTPKPLLGLLEIIQGLLENLCEVFQEKVANLFCKFEVPVQREPVESHTPCLVVSHMSNFVYILVLFLLFCSISLGKLRWVFCTSGFWPRVRARALHAPVFFSSLTHKTGRCAPPQPIAVSLLLIHSPKIIN